MKYLLLFLVLGTSMLFSSVNVIDFTYVPYRDPFNGTKDFNVWRDTFNSAPEFGIFFEKLKNDFQISTAIETGTWEEGRTTKFFSYLFDKVHTIEFDDKIYEIAQSRLQSFANITCYHGSSEKILESLLPLLKNQRVLFYLDAHWYEPWPLLDELEMISRTHKDNCIVAIDDFKVPGRPDIAYDAYGSNECSFEYISNKLEKIFSDCDCFYLIPKNLNSRAKFVALPRNWGFKF